MGLRTEASGLDRERKRGREYQGEIICPFCNRDLKEHGIESCLADLRYFATGDDVRSEGLYSDEEMKKIIEEYQRAVRKGIGVIISLTKIVRRINTAINAEWVTCRAGSLPSQLTNLLRFFFRYYEVDIEK